MGRNLDKYVLVIIQKPKPNEASRKLKESWLAFATALEGTPELDSQKTRLAKNVWLLLLNNETGIFANLVSLAQKYEVPCRVLYFQDDPIEYQS